MNVGIKRNQTNAHLEKKMKNLNYRHIWYWNILSRGKGTQGWSIVRICWWSRGQDAATYFQPTARNCENCKMREKWSLFHVTFAFRSSPALCLRLFCSSPEGINHRKTIIVLHIIYDRKSLKRPFMMHAWLKNVLGKNKLYEYHDVHILCYCLELFSYFEARVFGICGESVVHGASL